MCYDKPNTCDKSFFLETNNLKCYLKWYVVIVASGFVTHYYIDERASRALSPAAPSSN